MSIAFTSQLNRTVRQSGLFISSLKSKIRLHARAEKSGPKKNDSFIMLFVSPYLANNHILIVPNLNSVVMSTLY